MVVLSHLELLLLGMVVIYWNKDKRMYVEYLQQSTFFVLTVLRIIAVHSLKGMDPIVIGSEFVVVICYRSQYFFLCNPLLDFIYFSVPIVIVIYQVHWRIEASPFLHCS